MGEGIYKCHLGIKIEIMTVYVRDMNPQSNYCKACKCMLRIFESFKEMIKPNFLKIFDLHC